MKTSVVIPNWNGKNLLEKNLPSVIAMGADEVIISDDASTDDSVNFIKLKYPKIKIVLTNKNTGFSGNVNRGVKIATGDIIVLLNTDVIPEKNIIKNFISHFQDTEVFGVSFNEREYGPAQPLMESGFLNHRPGKISVKAVKTFWISGGSGAFRKSMWDKLSGLDEMFNPFYWEDLDLCFRAQRMGWKLIWEPKAIVAHKHETTINKNNFPTRYLNYMKERNQLLFNWKNLPLHILFTDHLFGVLKRLKNPGYFVVILISVFKIPEILHSRMKHEEYKYSPDSILMNFQK